MALVSKAFQDIITFSRASSGTYVNSNGYITNSSVLNYLTYSNQPENAAWTKSNSFVQQNLVTYSQEFDNAAWTKVAVTCAGAEINATIAPDGTLTADKVSEDGTLSTHWVFENITTTAAPYTASFYFKAAERSWAFIRIRDSGGNDRFAWFNLSAGTVGTVQTNLTATISAANNGFYRCVATVSAALAGSNPIVAGIATADNISSYTGTVGSGIYMWGSNFVQGSVPGDYRATTSAALPCLYADYNGALRARKLSETAVTNVHLLQNNLATVGLTQTHSVYAKAAERSQLYLQVGTSGAYFNLSTGAVISGSGATITLVRDGWYRCEIAASPVLTNTNVFVAVANGGVNSYAGDGSSGIYIADAQLNDGSSALAYYDTTASAYNAPRFDYDPVTLAAKGLLVEEQRANLLLQSSNWAATWSNTNITLGASVLAPDGTTTATRLQATASAVTSSTQNVTATATSHTYSIYAKQGSAATDANTFILRNFTTSTNLAVLTIDYSTGVITQTTGTGATATNAGNGFWRIVIPATSGITIGNTLIAYACYSGASETAGEYAYVWGAQLEAGAFATSYIPTVASQVTRAADVASVNLLSPWYNSVAGTLYAEFLASVDATATYRTQLRIADAGSTNYVQMRYQNPSATTAITNNQVVAAGATQADLSSASLSAPAILKTALSFAANNFSACTNGATPVTDVSGTMPTGLASLSFTGGSFNSGQTWMRRITYYPRVFTAAEQQTLTTL